MAAFAAGVALAGGLLLAPAAGAVTNLVRNPGFETGTSGWNTSGGASGVMLTQVAGGHLSGYAAKLTNANGSNAECLLNDSPNWVAKTSAGSYRGSLWVRADSAGATLTVRFREYSVSGARLAVATSRMTLTTSWQHVAVTLPVSLPGGSTVDFNAYVANAAPGTCFYADDAMIVGVPPNALPTAALTVGPGSDGAPLGVTADALASTSGAAIAGYTFDFGDGSAPVGPQTGASATHAYAAPGDYAVTVKVTDAAGRISSATQQVTVPYTSPSPAPTAVLTLDPIAGSEPMAITIDASGSMPGASPIYSYSYDYGYGPPLPFRMETTVVWTSTWQDVYIAAGTWAPKLTVTDTDGRATSTYGRVNVFAGFESDTSGWNTSGGSSGIALTRVAGGHTGGYAAELANTNTTSATCLLNDSPNLVAATSPGQYTGALWARADTTGATLKLRLREYGASGALLSTNTTSTTLSTSWQEISVTLPVTAPGSTIDLNAYVTNAPPGSCFYADDAGISTG